MLTSIFFHRRVQSCLSVWISHMRLFTSDGVGVCISSTLNASSFGQNVIIECCLTLFFFFCSWEKNSVHLERDREMAKFLVRSFSGFSSIFADERNVLFLSFLSDRGSESDTFRGSLWVSHSAYGLFLNWNSMTIIIFLSLSSSSFIPYSI